MIHILIGTRAQLIKMIPLMHMMQERGVEYNFIFMAQHHETIYEMLNDFGIKKPDYVLCDFGTDIVSSKQMTLWSFKVLLSGIWNKSEIFKGDKKGVVLIHGDAPPLLLGAILANVQGLAVASVEAGLRSFNLWKPFPEEITRVLTGKLGLIDLFFCQDEAAMRNVNKYRGKAFHTFGNTIIDSIRMAADINSNIKENGPRVPTDKYAVVSLHRFETISNEERLSLVVELVLRVAKEISLKFIFHPPTREALLKTGLYEKLVQSDRIELLPRMSFLAFNALISRSEFIVTDGGSNQEESAYLGIPCLLFRTETERQEGLGRNVVLSEFDTDVIDKFIVGYDKHSFPKSTALSSPTELILEEIMTFA